MPEEWTFNQLIVGELLRQARKLRGYSLREVQEMTGSSASHILRVESGEYDVLLKTFLRIANCLDVPPGMLLEQGARINRPFYANIIGESGELLRYIPAMKSVGARRAHATEFFTSCAVLLAYLIKSSNPVQLVSITEFPHVVLRNSFGTVAENISSMIIADRASLRIDLHSDPIGLLTSLEIVPKEIDEFFGGVMKYSTLIFTGAPEYLKLLPLKYL